MKHKHARPFPFWRGFCANLLIIAAVALVSLTQYSGLTKPLPSGALDSIQIPFSTPTDSSAANAHPTPTAAAPSIALPTTKTALATPAVNRSQTPAAKATLSAQTPAPLTTRTPIKSTSWPSIQVLGDSTLGWPIEAYQFGNGPIHLALIGGIHGGYEWNTILLAYEVIDHFSAHPEQIPPSISLYIVPSANPDGQVRVLNHAGRFTSTEVPTDTFRGRFNGNQVDLNRNWDQNWTSVGTWGNQAVSGGDEPFSEVETQILRDFLATMDAVVLWHSARPGVYMASCDEVYPPSQALAAIYAAAAQYPLYESFYDYDVTGTATDWLACAGTPAIDVELSNHTDTDRAQNLTAIQAVIDEYSAAVRREELPQIE